MFGRGTIAMTKMKKNRKNLNLPGYLQAQEAEFKIHRYKVRFVKKIIRRKLSGIPKPLRPLLFGLMVIKGPMQELHELMNNQEEE